MNVFDQTINNLLQVLSSENMTKLETTSLPWEEASQNSFLMERDTAIELGGYPKESVNIYVPSVNMRQLLHSFGMEEGVYLVGDTECMRKGQKHISFGKLVFLTVDGIPEEEWYTFTQKELLTDAKIIMKDVMLRQSPTHYTLNMRVGKKAIKEGFDFAKMGNRIYAAFQALEHVTGVTVMLIVGDSPLYKDLLDYGEQIKEITLTLNHILDGFDMDCGHCDLSVVCNEVEGMRLLHKRQIEKK